MQLEPSELTTLIRSTRKEDIIGDPKHGKAYIKKGNGIHSVFIDMETGESSEEVHDLVKVSKWDDCDHFFVMMDDGANAQCRDCGLGQKIILGPQQIINGKIVFQK